MLYATTMKTIEFNVNGQTISGISQGNVEGPILLCLHGWLDNAASFQPLMPYFSNYLADHHVIAIDWAGHGLSSHRSQDAHYHFLDWVYDLMCLFRSQHWQAVDIVAHSMGAMIASAFTSAFPEHVKSLTLIDSIGLLTSEPEGSTEQLRKGLLSRLTRDIKPKNKHASIESAVAARVSVSDLSTENAALIVNRGIEQTPSGFIWRSDHRLRAISPYRFTMAQAQQLISNINTAVQLLYGSKGMEMVTAGLQNFGPLFKNLTVQKLNGGHHVHMEQAEQCVKLIGEFIKQRQTKTVDVK
ncbi:alpha/beta hydrolase [Colwellia sp. Arc7-635]|uniref:alpha/beta fold hydrolase n=1 Tax=Colwellia sp. Arc7-635 TaxID=2497879 RepID=UPI000F852063|nr:alpha/beta hydrolase [Colwellia sp. Arc7-635]AZQ84051.1 alpha/beta hydrolase [Colwellia sp. Arc7-635]